MTLKRKLTRTLKHGKNTGGRNHMYDIVIVGAGVAGASASYLLAKKGFEVLLVDHLTREQLGTKACGELVNPVLLDELRDLSIDKRFILQSFHDTEIYIKGEKIFTIKHEGFVIDKSEFIKNLVKKAEKHDAIFQQASFKKAKLHENGLEIVIGNKTISAKMIIDCSGSSRVVARQFKLIEQILEHETAIAYRGLCQIEPEVKNRTLINFDTTIYPFGYAWIIPHPKHTNVGAGGVGIDATFLIKRLREITKIFGVKLKECTDIRGALLPIRRPLTQIVADGLALIGDSACQVNPMSGAGIVQAMIASQILANSIEHLVDTSKLLFTVNDLWNYAYSYMTSWGTLHAMYDVTKYFFAELSIEELKYMLEKELLTQTDISTLEANRYNFSRIFLAIKKIGRLAKKPKLLRKLLHTLWRIRKVKKIYRNYPKVPDRISEFYKKQSEFFNIKK